MIAVERYGPVTALCHGRTLPILGRPFMTVRCFAVDGLMVDTGLYAKRKAILDFAREHRVSRCLVTHHHEDHSNNARPLQAAGIPVLATPETASIVRRGFGTHPYQWLVWGFARRSNFEPLPDHIESDHYKLEVVSAPGHCDDQIVLYERNQGWLFSGDAFLGERIRYFRRDEHFDRTLETTRHLAHLDFDQLFCAHRPVATGGRAAMAAKLQHLETLAGETRRLHAQGLPEREIARRLLGRTPPLVRLLTLGDASGENLVRSILRGPRPRRW